TITGRAILDGRGGAADLVTLDAAGLRARRGRDIAMVFQDPMTSLNPVRTVGSLLIEAIRLHRPMERRAAGDEACRLLDLVGIPAPRQRL
ncbi:glutathione ABC transporter ATP-binding protein, partial [Acinetobacter baumannii]